MIRVTVDLVPFGDEALKKKIGSLVLANTETVNRSLCMYKAVYKDDITGLHKATTLHYREEGVWELLRKLLTDHEVRNAEEEIFKHLEERL